MIPTERDLERQVIQEIHDLKRTYPDQWKNPEALAEAMGRPVEHQSVGSRDGCTIRDRVVIDPASGVPARKRFTIYHEVIHEVIDTSDDILVDLHELPSQGTGEDLEAFIERLCDIGAGELLLPRETVWEAMQTSGFSLSTFQDLLEGHEASRTATLVQMVLCAPHRCIGLVLRRKPMPQDDTHTLMSSRPDDEDPLVTCVSFASPDMKYSVGLNVPMEPGHLIERAYESEEHVEGEDDIPFRKTTWETECEAIRKGSQVFALFHVDSPPTGRDHDQTALRFWEEK